MFFWALTTAYPTLRTISTPLANLLRPQSDWPILEVDRVLPSFYRVSSPTIGFDLRLRGWATLPGCLLRFITGSLCFFFPFFSIRFGCVSIAEDCGRGRCHRSPQKRADFVINAGLLFFPFFFPVFTDEEVLLFFFRFPPSCWRPMSFAWRVHQSMDARATSFCFEPPKKGRRKKKSKPISFPRLDQTADSAPATLGVRTRFPIRRNRSEQRRRETKRREQVRFFFFYFHLVFVALRRRGQQTADSVPGKMAAGIGPTFR